jgi:hypothetical protein
MGWKLNGLALVAGLVSLTLGVWPVWTGCFGYLAYRLWRATRRNKVYIDKGDAGPDPRKPSRLKKRYVLAGAMVVLGLVAFSRGGTFSPLLFFSLALVVVLSGLLGAGPALSTVVPVPDSILVRRKWFPISWTCLAEVKFGTSQMAKVLSSINCEMLLTTDSERLSVYIPVRVTALSTHEAERKVVERLAPIARTLSTRGAYVLPLDEAMTASRLGWSLKQVDLALDHRKNGLVSLTSTPYDALALTSEGHLVKQATGYVMLTTAKRQRMELPSPGHTLRSQPLVWEVLEMLSEKFQVREADAYTNFLSSVCATQGEGLGDRLQNEGRDGAATMMVGSLGATQVQLTRPQLRAIVGTYR